MGERKSFSEVEKNVTKLINAGPDDGEYVEIFKDWQSSKLISIKKFLISINTLIIISFVSGIEFSHFLSRGENIAESRIVLLIVLVLLSIIISSIYFEYLRRQDWAIRQFRIETITRNIKISEESIDEIGSLLVGNYEDGFQQIFKDDRVKILAYTEKFLNVSLYKIGIKGYHKKYELIQRIEWTSIQIACCISILFLLVMIFK